jgi:hypothetical protein
MAQSTPTPNELLDLLANLALYDPTRYPGVTFTATDFPVSYTSNGTVWVLNGGGGVAASFFGDGSAGDVNIGVVAPLAADLYADHLVVLAGGDLQTRGWKVYARTSLVVAVGGKITNNGFAGAGNVAGVATGKGTCVDVGLAGGKGGVVGVGVAGTQVVGACVDPIGGSGGDGGNAVINAGGLGGTPSTDPTTGGFHTATDALELLPSGFMASGGAALIGAGQGGGGGGSDAGGEGGGGGGGGGIVFMASPSIVNNGTIEAKGGAGGNGTTGGDQGGGGGGGGGVVFRVSTSAPTGTGSVVVTPGAGGNALGGGAPGAAGASGQQYDFLVN